MDGNICVIGIDSKSLDELGPFHTWSRNAMAQAIQVLNQNSQAKPAVIGIDVMYYGESEPEADQTLAEACASSDNIVVANNVVFQNELQKIGKDSYSRKPYQFSMLEEPYEQLKKATKQGHINTIVDMDGVVRHHMYQISSPDGSKIPSFAAQLYQQYAKVHSISTKEPRMDHLNRWYIPFVGKPGAYYDYYSFSDLLNGELTGDMFEGCAVLIGAYAPGLMDSYETSMDHSNHMYGVEIHANILDALLRQKFKIPVPIYVQILLGMIFIIFAVKCFETMRGYGIFLAIILSLFLYIAGCKVLYELGYMLNVFIIPMCLCMAFLGVSLQKYMKEALEKRHVINMFKRYLEPKVVDELLKSGTAMAGLHGVSTEIACLFVDIRGFTSMAETLEPTQVVEILDRYFELITRCVFKYGGTLDKFIGDAAMALFNAPLPMKDYVYLAVCTAWDMVQGCAKLSEELKEKYGQEIFLGVGVHCGTAVVGNIGTIHRMDYTAIGNTVNIASRLESLAKAGQVLISREVYEAVNERLDAEYMGRVLLKGKTQEVEVFIVTSITAQV